MRLILFFSILTGCTTTFTNCPSLVTYEGDFNERLVNEISGLPENAAIIRALSDYATLRDQIRVCQ